MAFQKPTPKLVRLVENEKQLDYLEAGDPVRITIDPSTILKDMWAVYEGREGDNFVFLHRTNEGISRNVCGEESIGSMGGSIFIGYCPNEEFLPGTSEYAKARDLIKAAREPRHRAVEEERDLDELIVGDIVAATLNYKKIRPMVYEGRISGKEAFMAPNGRLKGIMSWRCAREYLGFGLGDRTGVVVFDHLHKDSVHYKIDSKEYDERKSLLELP